MRAGEMSVAAQSATVLPADRDTTEVVPAAEEEMSFSDKTKIGYKHYWYCLEQADVNYRKRGLDVFAALDYENYRERHNAIMQTTQYLPTATTEQDAHGMDFAKSPVYSGKAGFNYSSGRRDCGLSYDFSFRPEDACSLGSMAISRYVDGELSEEMLQDYTANDRNRQHKINAYYADSLGIFAVRANIDIVWQNNDRARETEESSTINAFNDVFSTDDINNRLIAGNITASVPIAKGELRFGPEITNIRHTDRYMTTAGCLSADDTKIKETTAALFAETDQTLGKAGLIVGLRGEFTSSGYYLSGVKQSDASRHYMTLLPSAAIFVPTGDVRTRLSYTRTCTRPIFEQLSSAVRYVDRYNYSTGNPSLRPVYRDIVSLAVEWKDLTAEATYRSTKNLIIQQTSPSAASDYAAVLSAVNLPRYNSWTVALHYSPRFGFWHPSLDASIAFQDMQFVIDGAAKKLNKPMGTVRFDNALFLPMDIRFNATLSIRSSGNTENLYLKNCTTIDLGLFKSFKNDTWTVRLQCNDICGKWRRPTIVYDTMSTTVIKKKLDTRDLSLTVCYNLNRKPSRYGGTGAGNRDKGRL